MRLTLQEIMKDNKTLQEHYERLVELCQIHKCLIRYCLKEVKAKVQNDADLRKQGLVRGTTEHNKDTLYKCRFGYPEDLYGFQATHDPVANATNCQKITAIGGLGVPQF